MDQGQVRCEEAVVKLSARLDPEFSAVAVGVSFAVAWESTDAAEVCEPLEQADGASRFV